jgi:pyruvate kinase
MKTVFTLGPASESLDILTCFCQIANRFRLNVAHLTPETLDAWLSRLAHVFNQLDCTLPVVLDLQGAKMRIGKYPTCEQLPSNVTLFFGQSSTEIQKIPVPHADLFEALTTGDMLLLNDARIKLVVTDIKEGCIQAKVLTNGQLSTYKGINCANHPVPFTQLVESDKTAVAIGLKYPFVQFACSFILDGQEGKYLRDTTASRHLIAKIERPEAMAYLQQIDNLFDETWFCRGDLGAQAGLNRLGALQANFIASFPLLRQPKFLAGQVLEHMTHFPEPTRSEVVHLYDTRCVGFDGIVFSDETAIGRYPKEVALFLNSFMQTPLTGSDTKVR